jgi:hypothetical protein
MTNDLPRVLTAVRDWHAKQRKPKLHLSDITFGSTVMFAGSLAIVDAYTRNNDGPHTIHVRFACDHRRTTFPVTLDQLEPSSASKNHVTVN